MDASTIGQIAASAGFTGLVGVVVNAIVTRRRVGAEATEIITKAAGGMVERLEQEAARAREEAAGLRTDLDRERRARQNLERRFERERIAWRHTLQVHAAWDILALQRITSPPGTPPLPDPPPLTPPTRASDFGDDDED